jgi:KUP system potassium uptake protein
VYGDIGTSPLYALREAFHTGHIAITPSNVYGILSLILWALIIVISIKYLGFILRADNRGEGGMLALTSLISTAPETGLRRVLLLLGMFGTALLYGDGMITPSISVLSAVEGLKTITPVFVPYIRPITVVILVVLFAFQSHGTEKVGRIFGPVMVLWFVTIAVLGLHSIIQTPAVLAAINPIHAVHFFLENRFTGYFVLGAVFLVITGGEALYADMGHFGREPIRRAWFAIVLPALLLNYFGQGALLLRNPAEVEHPFFHLAPEWAELPLVILATMATVIASQALISGAFSITMQAVQLGIAPRVLIEHTSPHERGQIYVPLVNWGLMLACIGLVLGFQSSSNLAAAYGVGVTTDMVITTVLFFVVVRERWRWSLPAAIALAGFFFLIDVAFWGATLIKIPHGGWFPLVVAAIIFTLFSTWKRGRMILAERLERHSRSLPDFAREVATSKPVRVPGTAVFMFRNLKAVPPALVQNLLHNKVLHERNAIVCVHTADTPHAHGPESVEVSHPADDLYTITIHTGFMDEPDVPAALLLAKEKGFPYEPEATTYILGRENLIASKIPGMAIWREKLFAWMSRNARSAPMYFRIPPERVVELGTQIEL